jgi:RHS repeat-associated protein
MNKPLVSFLTLALSALLAWPTAHAEDSRNGLRVTLPNGYANVAVDDLRVASTAGAVRWTRHWDGQEWKFNPHWESLSQSWKNLTGSQSANTTGGTSGASTASSGGNGGGCWVWVDDDWQPSTGSVVIGGVPQAGPMVPIRTTPFNRVMGEGDGDYPPPQRVSVDYAALCAGSGGAGARDAEAIRKANELYLGEAGRYAFSNRTILEKRGVRQLPGASAAAQYAALATGAIALAPVDNAKGFRWIDRGGAWIDYNTQGQVVAWGDQNDNRVWMLRDLGGVLRGVADANGHVLYSLHYTGELVTEVRDYGVGAGDPGRSVKYAYDAHNRLVRVTDARGNASKYDYDAGNRIVAITDAEGRTEQLGYSGDTVKRRTAPDGAVTDYEFDYDDTNKQFGSKITGPETAAGRRVEDYTHNRVGKLVRTIVNGRTEAEVRYDTAARSRIVTNARGFTTRVSSNEFDQAVEIVHPDGAGEKRSYSAQHLGLTEEVDELGVKTRYQYDDKGRLAKKTEAAGSADARVTDYTRNSLGQITSVTSRGRTEANGTLTLDAVWLLEYDALGQLKKTTDPEANVRQYRYDHAGNLVGTTDPRGNATRYEVDAGGNLSKVSDALGRSRSYEYDKVGNLIVFTDARAKTVRAAYDAMNRRWQSSNAVGGVYKVQYNGQGLVVSETDEDGGTTLSEYDNFFALTKQTDALNNATQFGYQVADGSAAGLLGSLNQATEVIYPTFTRQTRFDRRERQTSESLKNSNAHGQETLTSSVGYDKRGQVTSELDANGNSRTRGYNAFGQQTEHVDALAGKTSYEYDARGNLLQVSDAKGNVHRFDYDRNDRVVKQTLPLGQSTRFGYDAAGNVVEKIDPLENKSSATYDTANRLVEIKQYKADGTLLRSSTLTLDANDNLAAWSDTDHVANKTSGSRATFDDANRKTGETVTYPGGHTLSYGYAYSAAGKKMQLAWPDGTQIAYGYSPHGMLASVTIPGEGAISVNRYKWTAAEQTALPGGGAQEKTYDGLLKLQTFKVKSPAQQSVLELSHQYGKVQELKKRSRTDTANNTSTTQSHGYQYDKEDRLAVATTDGGGLFGMDTEGFTLDAVANRVAHTKQSGAWLYDANNRLTRRGSGACGAPGVVCYEYDAAGNLGRQTEGAKLTRYGYNASNQLVEVKDGAAQLVARYGYDPLGRRIWKEQYRDRSGAALAQARRTHFLYADEGLIAEASQSITLNADLSVTANGGAAITTQYGPRPDAMFGTGILFVKTQDSNGKDRYAYYHHDHLDTPIQATDKQGNVVWAARYEPFGRAQIVTPVATVDKPTITSNLRLPGQYEDQETGLHYNYHRDYDPQTGRYVQSDPIGLEGGINTYGYVGGNPVIRTDPLGLAWVCQGVVPFVFCRYIPPVDPIEQGFLPPLPQPINPWTDTNTETRTPAFCPPDGPDCNRIRVENYGRCNRLFVGAFALNIAARLVCYYVADHAYKRCKNRGGTTSGGNSDGMSD